MPPKIMMSFESSKAIITAFSRPNGTHFRGFIFLHMNDGTEGVNVLCLMRMNQSNYSFFYVTSLLTLVFVKLIVG